MLRNEVIDVVAMIGAKSKKQKVPYSMMFVIWEVLSVLKANNVKEKEGPVEPRGSIEKRSQSR
ncbi:MAG: hypothetical protein GY853_01170 [PVC group bacterium]|nr:hypothetical protein [PVC group bacterium]